MDWREKMERNKRKYEIIIILSLLMGIMIGIIYGLGGKIAPWIWNGWIFVLAPIAVIASIVQKIRLIIHFFQKKTVKKSVALFFITLLYAYPITVLFGCSVLTYPTLKSEEEGIQAVCPVKDAICLGGKHYKTHASWPSECYAYDLVKEPYDHGSKELGDYGIYLNEVVAPIEGVIVDMKEDEENIEPNSEEFISQSGNYVVIYSEKTDSYVLLVHLEKNSVEVNVGDLVYPNQVIAKVGNSGTTSEPHLHIQHQKNNPIDSKIVVCSEALPIYFEE